MNYNLLIPLGIFLLNSLFSMSALAKINVIQLVDSNNKITINPDSLQTKWNDHDVNQSGLIVDGIRQKAFVREYLTDSHARWKLQPSNISVEAKFSTHLQLTFQMASARTVKRNQPITLKWFNLEENTTQELYLPFSEGMRVPTSNPMWIDYLSQTRDGSNTTQDLKMPFWTAKQGSRYITWHTETATNNQLSFVKNGKKLDMKAAHQFTALNVNQPFTVSIHVGEDWLSGAKFYRQWREQQGFANSLAQKRQTNPEIEKLIGASQVYLFGSDGISVQDVNDWWGLHTWLLERSALNINAEAKDELLHIKKGKDWFSNYHKQLMIETLNLSLSKKFTVPAPTMDNNTIEAQYLATQQKKAWLLKHAGKYLVEPARWGQAISTDMLNTLKSSQLTRLWLGFDNWLPAFYQPQTIDQAKQLGYLVGTYDSYNTAIPRGLNNGWLTAQLPDQVRKQCAIEQADGTKKKGFRGNGFYLNPSCQNTYIQQRITDIINFGRFNSLFIDVDATAMAREDYRSATNESDMLEAFNIRMQTIVDRHNIVLGSEDGNSLTTSGIAFAHGLETIGFGWRDKEMTQKRSSPFYLGRWYPEHKPDFFFKPVQVKEPYKTLLFSPEFRIPLYQAVFHDEVINSHHWHFDSLKFSNVKIQRDLTAMLYNVPAMVHLSRDEALSPQSERIKQLKHYQDGYLPIHQALWDKQLLSFDWLDENGLIQQTRYSDGSKVIVNFTTQEISVADLTVAPQSALVSLSKGQLIQWQPLEVK